MYRKRFWVVPLAALLIIALVAIGGFTIHRAAWSQGYTMGQLAAGVEEGAPMPYGPHRFGYPSRPFGLGSFFCAPALFVLGGLMLVGMFAKVLHFRAWRRAMVGGPKARAWARQWDRHPGHVPPWCWEWEKPPQGKTEEPDTPAKAEADAPSTAAEVERWPT